MGCSKCYVGLQFIIWKIQQHEVSFFFWFLHTLLKIIICQTLITCTIYIWLYIGIICIMQKYYLKWIYFFGAKFHTMVKKTLCEGCKGGFLKTKGTKTTTFLGGNYQNLSYLDSTFLRQVKQNKILIFFYFPT